MGQWPDFGKRGRTAGADVAGDHRQIGTGPCPVTAGVKGGWVFVVKQQLEVFCFNPFKGCLAVVISVWISPCCISTVEVSTDKGAWLNYWKGDEINLSWWWLIDVIKVSSHSFKSYPLSRWILWRLQDWAHLDALLYKGGNTMLFVRYKANKVKTFKLQIIFRFAVSFLEEDDIHSVLAWHG